MQVGSHYSLLANAVYTRQIYHATAIESGRVIAWKAIMTVEAAGHLKVLHIERETMCCSLRTLSCCGNIVVSQKTTL